MLVTASRYDDARPVSPLATAAVDALESHPDAAEAFAAAGDLARLVPALRERLAERVWRAEALSLSGLARRLSVSKPRAHQLVRAAESDRERETHDG